MLTATIKIRSIDYESTFQQIFPVLSEKIKSWTSRNMIVRLFQQLGDAALPVSIGVMRRIPEDTKNELLVRVLNAYAPELRDKLNREFRKDEWGQFFEIGTIFIDQQTELLLNIGQIKVDYPALLNKDQVNSAINEHLGIFSGLARAAANVTTALLSVTRIEKMGLDLLWRGGNNVRLMNLIKSALSTHGIKLELSEIQLMQDKDVPEDLIESSQPFALTEKMENDIICALADYLRDNISNSLTSTE